MFLEEKCFFGIYIYEGVEPIDLATLGVLSMVRRIAPEHPPIDAVRAGYPGIDVQNAMLVDNGSIIAGGGVTPCIDAALYILETCLGPEVAAETARMDHSRARKANSEQFPSIINDSAHDGRDRVKQRRRADSH